MKQIFLLFCLAAFMIFAACKKESDNDNVLSPERLAGVWRPYESIGNGGVFTGDLGGLGLFGAYAESVQINIDYSFVPVSINNAGNKLLKTDERGTYRLYPLLRKMEMSGIFEIDARIIKLTSDEMWLNLWGVLYKFRKQAY